MNNKYIVWKTNVAQTSIASIRYRCLLPALFLEGLNYNSIILEKNEEIYHFNKVLVIVFVKTFSEADYRLALNAHNKGIPVILDLCDNIFVKNYSNPENFNKFEDLSKISSAIITPSEELAKIIKSRTIGKNIYVVPDQVETLSNTTQVLNKYSVWRGNKFKVMDHGRLFVFFNKFFLKKITASLNHSIDFIRNNQDPFLMAKKIICRIVSVFKFKKIKVVINGLINGPNLSNKISSRTRNKKIVWFGNHGASHSSFGMACLLDLKEVIEKVHQKIGIELVVISNNDDKFNKIISPLPFPTTYIPWDLLTIFKEIAQCDVCVIPSSQDEFSLCKSPNRTLLALSLGVPVVATSMPSLNQLKECIVLDNWETGIVGYLTDDSIVKADLAKARKIIKEKYSGESIASKWDDVLKETIKSNVNVADCLN